MTSAVVSVDSMRQSMNSGEGELAVEYAEHERIDRGDRSRLRHVAQPTTIEPMVTKGSAKAKNPPVKALASARTFERP